MRISFFIGLLYLLFVLITVTWFSKYIVKPIEKVTALAQLNDSDENDVEFRQVNAPTEVSTLSDAIQEFTQRITVEKR